MLKIQQNHGIKYILDRFERFRWKFQFEKRNEYFLLSRARILSV